MQTDEARKELQRQKDEALRERSPEPPDSESKNKEHDLGRTWTHWCIRKGNWRWSRRIHRVPSSLLLSSVDAPMPEESQERPLDKELLHTPSPPPPPPPPEPLEPLLEPKQTTLPLEDKEDSKAVEDEDDDRDVEMEKIVGGGDDKKSAESDERSDDEESSSGGRGLAGSGGNRRRRRPSKKRTAGEMDSSAIVVCF